MAVMNKLKHATHTGGNLRDRLRQTADAWQSDHAGYRMKRAGRPGVMLEAALLAFSRGACPLNSGNYSYYASQYCG